MSSFKYDFGISTVAFSIISLLFISTWCKYLFEWQMDFPEKTSLFISLFAGMIILFFLSYLLTGLLLAYSEETNFYKERKIYQEIKDIAIMRSLGWGALFLGYNTDFANIKEIINIGPLYFPSWLLFFLLLSGVIVDIVLAVYCSFLIPPLNSISR